MNAEERAAVIDGLQRLVDALRTDERVPLPFDGTVSTLGFFPDGLDGDGLAHVIRVLGGTGWQQRIKPSTGSGPWLEVTGRIAGLRVMINANADEVCEPIPPQPVIERKCPALDAFLAENGDPA